MSDIKVHNVDSTVTLTQLVQALQSFGNNASPDKWSYQNNVPEFDPAQKEQTVVMW